MTNKLGRSSFKSKLKPVVSARSNLLEDYFETKDQIFMTKNVDKVTIPLTYNTFVSINKKNFFIRTRKLSPKCCLMFEPTIKKIINVLTYVVIFWLKLEAQRSYKLCSYKKCVYSILQYYEYITTITTIMVTLCSVGQSSVSILMILRKDKNLLIFIRTSGSGRQ